MLSATLLLLPGFEHGCMGVMLVQVQTFCDHEGKTKGPTQILTQNPAILQLPSSGLLIM